MALTEDEKSAIRHYLGWSDRFREIDPRLESMMGAVSSYAETRVRAALTRLGQIDTALQDAALNNLDLVGAEAGVSFRGPEQLGALRQAGRVLVQQVAIVFEVEPKRDYFGVEGATGGVIPLG
jgi:hypothetical protein